MAMHCYLLLLRTSQPGGTALFLSLASHNSKHGCHAVHKYPNIIKPYELQKTGQWNTKQANT